MARPEGFQRGENNNDATAQPSASGTICGVRVEEVAEPTMREIRNLAKLIDELAKGRPMEKILRQG